jgi:hypothetical protein
MRNVILLLAFTLVLAYSQGKMSPEQRQAMLDYQLTLPRANSLITAMDAMTKYVVSLPDYADRLRKSATMTPAQRLAQVENDSKAMAILKQNNLTAKDYIVGVPVLRQALMAASGGVGANITASPANIAFAKANLATLKPKMDAADGLTTSRK